MVSLKNSLDSAPPEPQKEQVILHVDMDAFYASVEQNDNPDLRGKPVVIGEPLGRSVVSAASYEARKFGVRSAMPMSQARLLCPQAIIVSGRMHRYVEVSHLIMDELRNFTPLMQPASIDEAYLDVSGLTETLGPHDIIAQAIQKRIFQVSGLNCSIGVAPVKFLAKIASDVNKPNGYFILTPETMHSFLQSLPVQRIPGVGKKMYQDIKKLGITLVGQVLEHKQEFWEQKFGKLGTMLYLRAQGQDSARVEPFTPSKSESAEHTLEKDTRDFEELSQWILLHSHRVCLSLRQQTLTGRTITVKIKYEDFQQVSRSLTLPHRTNSLSLVYNTALELFKKIPLTKKVRLIGVGISNFTDATEQLTLPLQPDATAKHSLDDEELNLALDKVRNKFGKDIIKIASLLRPKLQKIRLDATKSSKLEQK